jgi:hypothetical protein
MITICWTVLRHATASVVRGAHSFGHPIRHLLRARHLLAARPRMVATMVCRLIPAAMVTGGLLAPVSFGPPLPPPPEPTSAVGTAPPVVFPAVWPYGMSGGLSPIVEAQPIPDAAVLYAIPPATPPWTIASALPPSDPSSTEPPSTEIVVPQPPGPPSPPSPPFNVPEPPGLLALMVGLGWLLLVRCRPLRSGRLPGDDLVLIEPKMNEGGRQQRCWYVQLPGAQQ